jgi:hypothetical protein
MLSRRNYCRIEKNQSFANEGRLLPPISWKPARIHDDDAAATETSCGKRSQRERLMHGVCAWRNETHRCIIAYVLLILVNDGK